MVKGYAIVNGLFVIPSYALLGPGYAAISALFACVMGYAGIVVFHMNRIFLPIVQVNLLALYSIFDFLRTYSRVKKNLMV